MFCFLFLFHFPFAFKYSISTVKANRALVTHFLEVLTSESFKIDCPILELVVRHLLLWVINVDASAVRSALEIMKTKVDTHSKPLEKLMFSRSPDQILKDTGTEEVRKILCASLFFDKYGHKDQLVRQPFFKLFR